jgi:hypothetical protein
MMQGGPPVLSLQLMRFSHPGSDRGTADCARLDPDPSRRMPSNLGADWSASMVLYSQCFDLLYETFLPFGSRTFIGSSLRSKVAISLTSA